MVCFRQNCITRKDQHVILLRNSTDKFITVKKNENVGKGIELDQVIYSDEQIPADGHVYNQPEIRSVDIESTKFDQIKKQIPEYLRSITRMCFPEMILIWGYLMVYRA